MPRHDKYADKLVQRVGPIARSFDGQMGNAMARNKEYGLHNVYYISAVYALLKGDVSVAKKHISKGAHASPQLIKEWSALFKSILN